MKRIDFYISEKLHLDKDIEIEKNGPVNKLYNRLLPKGLIKEKEAEFKQVIDDWFDAYNILDIDDDILYIGANRHKAEASLINKQFIKDMSFFKDEQALIRAYPDINLMLNNSGFLAFHQLGVKLYMDDDKLIFRSGIAKSDSFLIFMQPKRNK